MVALRVGAGLLAVAVGCGNPRSADPTGAPDPTAAKPVLPHGAAAVQIARAEFEVVADDLVVGTSKIYSRSDLLADGDERGMDEGDFVGRLRTLFGVTPGDAYVLRHRKTGTPITAYSGASGPSYGGLGDGAAGVARVQADALVHRTPAVLTPAEMRRMADVTAPPGFRDVAARLEALLDVVVPADWEATRYYEDAPSVYRVGVRHGKAFYEDVPPTEGIALMLRKVAAEAPAKPGDEADIFDSYMSLEEVVTYWLALAEQGQRLDAVLPDVRAVWFRAAVTAQMPAKADDRNSLLDGMAEQAVGLGIEPAAAAAALAPRP